MGSRGDVLKVFLYENQPSPLLMMNQNCYIYFVAGDLVAVSAKLFSILTFGFKGEDV